MISLFSLITDAFILVMVLMGFWAGYQALFANNLSNVKRVLYTLWCLASSFVVIFIIYCVVMLDLFAYGMGGKHIWE